MKQAKHNGKVEGPRYVPKFTNGTWVVFDRVKFCVAATARTEKQAKEGCK